MINVTNEVEIKEINGKEVKQKVGEAKECPKCNKPATEYIYHDILHGETTCEECYLNILNKHYKDRTVQAKTIQGKVVYIEIQNNQPIAAIQGKTQIHFIPIQDIILVGYTQDEFMQKE